MKKTTLIVAALMIGLLAGAQTLKVGKLDNIKRLTNESTRFEYPRWSPDGKHLSFTAEGYTGLWVMDADGKNRAQLSDDTGVGYMHQWSADSREILVRDTRWNATANGVERMHAAWAIGLDGKKTRISDDSETMQPAAWRYNASGEKSIVAAGKKISASLIAKAPSTLMSAKVLRRANISYICDSENLYVVDESGRQRLLNAGPSFCPATSPDGKRVAFNQMDDIYVMNLDGSGKRLLARGYNASWVNDTQIVFERTTDDGHKYTSGDLFMINADGSSMKALTNTRDLIEMNPCVSNDGTKLVFTSATDGQVYTADLR